MLRPLPVAPTRRWFLAAIFAVLVAHDLHELTHTGVGRLLCGAWGTRDFNVWQLAPGCETWIPTLVGPVISWMVMWGGVMLLRSPDDGRRWTGLALVFAANPLGRLLPALVGGGDESVVARALVGAQGPWARLLVIAVACVTVVPPLVVAWRAMAMPRRGWWFGLLFIGGILVTGPVYLLLGNGLLARGVLSGPGLLGGPVLVELAILLALAGLALTWRGLRNTPVP